MPWIHAGTPAEDDVLTIEFLTHRSGVTNRNRGLNDHNSIRVIFHDQFDYSFDRRCIKVLSVAIVVCRCRYYNEICIGVCGLRIQRRGQI